MEEQALLFKTYYEQQMEIAKRLVAIRKNRKISQKRLSVLSGVPYATIRKFENCIISMIIIIIVDLEYMF